MNNNNINIKFTNSAVEEVLELISDSDEGTILRVGVKDGGCAGFSYVFEMDKKSGDDLVVNIDNKFDILVNPEHILHINNIEVDYEHGLKNRGFVFINPNAKTTCGCGISFS